MSDSLTGAEFKAALRNNTPKLGLFINSHSPTVVEQLAHSGYDWLLVDAQHGPMGYETLSTMIGGIAAGGAKSLVLGAAGLGALAGLGYAGSANDNVITALQVETASCIENIEEIAAVPGVDLLFLGQNDLCMSMGLYEKYQFPDMYTSPELKEATDALKAAAKKNNLILGLFLFGTDRVAEFREQGFSLISIGNDLHHILTQTGAHVEALEGIMPDWKRRPTALF